jgi:hypothetical protein
LREERIEVLGEVGAPIDRVQGVKEVGVEGVIYEGGCEEGNGLGDAFWRGRLLV